MLILCEFDVYLNWYYKMSYLLFSKNIFGYILLNSYIT